MSPGLVRHVAAVLVVVLTTSCGSSLEGIRPDEPVATPVQFAHAMATPSTTQAWTGELDDVDELSIVAIPYAPRKLHVDGVTREEFKAFMLGALRDIDFRRLMAELDPSPHEVLQAAWWGTQVEQKDIVITQGYLNACRKEEPRRCISLPPGTYLTRLQKYRVALGIGMDRFMAGFIDELGDEARAMVDPTTLTSVLVGAMLSYLLLLANPDPIFTKALAAAATLVMTAILSARTVCDLGFGFRDMMRQVDAAETFEGVAQAGSRYVEKVGAATARVLVMAVTALLCKGGPSNKLLGFPRLPQASAALLADTGGAMSLTSIRQVVGVKSLAGGLYVAMAEAGSKVTGNAAVAATGPAQGPAQQVQLPPGVTGHKTFKALKDAIGYPPAGYIWHHIVEQCRAYLFGNEAIQNRWNVILLDEETHLKVSAHYSSKRPNITGDKTVREWLKTKSYAEQRDYGIKLLRSMGVKVP